ncbi:MAG TPA: hypothetical protein VJG32_11470 [Anaerolineae bacterium]|nr:hypothetical protein [Anaerolineae bacterium]
MQDRLNTTDLYTRMFLRGPFGAGKTTLAIARLRALLEAGVPGESILVLAPRPALLKPYQAELRKPDLPQGDQVETLTIGEVARRSIELGWPAIAEAAGFAQPDQPPIFLSLEAAQYHIARVVEPLIVERLYFEDVYLPRNRIYTQLLDNLNKAASVGFPYSEIGQRLTTAWAGKQSRARTFTQVQDCANRFRQYCLDNNLLDFSLQLQLLAVHLLPQPWFRNDLFNQWPHLIVDNVEEDIPVTHDLLRVWLPESKSAVVCYDTDAGYRTLFGADPDSAWDLHNVCDQTVKLVTSHVISIHVRALEYAMEHALSASHVPRRRTQGAARLALELGGGRFHPHMLDWVTRRVAHAVQSEDIPLNEMVILAPRLPDALRFALVDRLARLGIPTRSLRPSRPPIAEPAARGLLTLAALAHPAWNLTPARPDIAHALSIAIDDLDPTRAHLLAERVYHTVDGAPALRSFEQLKPDLQERIGRESGARFERLHEWLDAYRAAPPAPLDEFLNRLFEEVLSQPGYGFYIDAALAETAAHLDRGRVAAQLIESARVFRQAVAPDAVDAAAALAIGKPYIELIDAGALTSAYVETPGEPQAVLVAPAYTFLLGNTPATIQFWLNVGSPTWWERLYQPLTHAYVLSRRWSPERKWTDAEEQRVRHETLLRLVRGLLRRCRSKVVLAYSNLNEQGFEERGPLLTAVQHVLQEA